jgi:hypothetical protein
MNKVSQLVENVCCSLFLEHYIKLVQTLSWSHGTLDVQGANVLPMFL